MIEIIAQDGVEIPEFQTPGAAAVDLRAWMPGQFFKVGPDEVAKIHTGIRIHMPENMAAIILPRSGLGLKGLVLANGTGLIDSDYQGEIMVCLWNRGLDDLVVRHGDRVAQMLFTAVFQPDFYRVQEFSSTTERGEGGFGSTGTS